MMGKFVVKSTGKSKYVFNLRAANGLTILTSESYTSRSAALTGIQSVRKNAGKGSNFELRTARNGKQYFVLLASNREVIGQSQMYASSAGAKKGIASVKANAVSSTVEDLTSKK